MTTSASIDPQTLPTADTVSRYTLPSGAVLLVRRNPTTPSVIIHTVVRAGGVDEPPQRTGLARFTAEMLTRGTETQSATQLWETAESLGASFDVSSSKHTLQFSAKCLAEDTYTLLTLLGDMQRVPTFPESEIERVRGETLTELDERMHSTRYVASLAFNELTFPATHPYSQPSMGTSESVSEISRNDLIAFYERTVPVRPMVTVVVGDVEPEAIRDFILRHWDESSGPRNGDIPRFPSIPSRTMSEVRHVVVDGKVQIDLILGGIGPKHNDGDFFAASLANVVLGGFGLMGRLGQSVREERGLAYYATSRLTARFESGIWECIAGVAPDHFDAAVDTIRAEITRLASEPVPEQEFADCKSSITGSLPLTLESNEGIAAVMTDIELFDLGWDYLLRFPDRIAAVTREEVMDTTRRYLDPATAVLASAGPALSATERMI